MAGLVPSGWYDISLPLKQGMHNLILDPVKPKIYRLHEAELGSPVTITMLEMLSHTGTHIDCPRHFIADGSTVTDMALDATVGPARVIEIKDPETITVEELEKHSIKKGERILCKTSTRPRCMNHRLGSRTTSISTKMPPPTLPRRRSSSLGWIASR